MKVNEAASTSNTGNVATTMDNTHPESERSGRIYKNETPYDISAALQLGIEHSIGKLSSKRERDLLMQDFEDVDIVFFPRDGSSLTPAHHHGDFTFKTYSPIAFRFFRELFGIQPQDFMMSMCDKSLKEIKNPGASGSLFFLTNDDKFIIKTVQKKEARFLQKLLPAYYLNVNQNKKTLLPKYFGLYSYYTTGGQRNIRIVVMNNLLPSVYEYQVKFDLKGSTYKRKASKIERDKNCPTLKDLDFRTEQPEGFYIDPTVCESLIKTLERDVRVLRSFKIMDYSLLIGVHKLTESSRSFSISESDTARLRSASAGASSGLIADDAIVTSRLGCIQAYTSSGEAILLFIGIIDILQSYRFVKKLEHAYKSVFYDGEAVSVTSPGFYCERFVNFCKNHVFVKRPAAKPQGKKKLIRYKSVTEDSSFIDKLDRSFNGPDNLAEELHQRQQQASSRTLDDSSNLEPATSTNLNEIIAVVHDSNESSSNTVAERRNKPSNASADIQTIV